MRAELASVRGGFVSDNSVLVEVQQLHEQVAVLSIALTDGLAEV